MGQTLEIEVTPTQITLDDVATAVVRLTGPGRRGFPQPSVVCLNFAIEPLAPLGGRQTARGRQWRFLLVPVEAGSARVDAMLMHGAEALTASADIRVLRVLPGEPRRATVQDDVTGIRFVTADVDRQSVYIHEQVTYRFRYYFETWLPTGDSPQYGFPPFDGFSSKPAGQTPADESQRVRIDGRDFFVEEIDMALYPIVSGDLQIGQTRLVLPRIVGRGRDLLTETVDVSVVPLPTPAPPEFTGGVGEFAVTATRSDARGAVGEGSRFVVHIRGRGDLDTLTKLPSPASTDGDIYPGPVDTQHDVIDGRPGGARTFEFVFVPRSVGVAIVVVPSISTFSPEARQYVTTEPQRLRITAVSAPGASPASSARTSHRRLPGPLVGAGAVVLAFAGAIAWRVARRRRGLGGERPARPRGHAAARPSGTIEALSAVETGDGKRVCRDVDRLVRAYAAATLGVHATDVPMALREAVAPGTQAVADVLATCAEGLYAPSSPDAPAQTELIRRAKDAVGKMGGEPGMADRAE